MRTARLVCTELGTKGVGNAHDVDAGERVGVAELNGVASQLTGRRRDRGRCRGANRSVAFCSVPRASDRGDRNRKSGASLGF